MKRRRAWLSLGTLAVFASAQSLLADEPDSAWKKIQYVKSESATGSARATIVRSAALVHTQQVVDPRARERANDHAAQFAAAEEQLMKILSSTGSGPELMARLNIYAKTDEAAAFARESMNKKYGNSAPAVTTVVGDLAGGEQLIALDAIALSKTPGDGKWSPPVLSGARRSTAAVMMPGRVLYVAGQAEKGASVREATRATMESLGKTLKHYQLGWGHVVHVKSFLTPISAQAEAEEEIARFFASRSAPPQAFVEWKSDLPIEIEMVVSVPPGASAAVEYSTPPGMTSSPVFSRVALVNSPEVIYIGGLHGQAARDGEGQVRDIFTLLREVCAAANSDLKHLAKATYYVSGDETSAKLNAIRPEFYDPQRPPSASKALVRGVGMAGRAITIDMIAVPAAKP